MFKKRSVSDNFEQIKKHNLDSLDLKDFIVEVVFKGFPVLRIFFLLSELLVRFGAGATFLPLALVLRLVPLLLLFTVHLSGNPRRQLHSWWQADMQSGGTKRGRTGAINIIFSISTTLLQGLSVIVIPRSSSSIVKINYL